VSSGSTSQLGIPDGYPNRYGTGVPAGAVLTAYTGPFTITTDTTIDSKIIDCSAKNTDFRVMDTAAVTVTNSRFVGCYVHQENSSYDVAGSAAKHITLKNVNIELSMLITNNGPDGLSGAYWNATNVKITGGRRGAYCDSNCTMQDSYISDMGSVKSGGGYDYEPTAAHMSPIRVGPNSVLRHNTVWCNVDDVHEAGCSSNLSIYGEYGQMHNITVDNNYFGATGGGYCAYGGNTHGRTDAQYIVFTNNLWERRPGPYNVGSSSMTESGGQGCGYYGTMSSFSKTNTGNAWTNNKYWPDGGAVSGDR
jgi:hypothetical protein